MTESDIVKLIKAGRTDDAIKQLFLQEGQRMGGFYKKGAPYKQAPLNRMHQVMKVPILDGIEAAGFTLAHDVTTELAPHRSDTYRGVCEDTQLTLIWHRVANQPHNSSFSLRLIMGNGDIWYWSDPGEDIGNRVVAFIKRWRKWQRQRHTIEQDIRKARKKLDVGSSAIDAILHKLLEENKLTYAIREEGKDRYLLVKLRYHRRIEIKLKPDMNMALLATLAELIATVRSAMDKVGSVTINVRGYGNNIDWKQSEAPAAKEGKGTEEEA